MTRPPVPDSADWQRRWTIEAGSVTLQPVTRGTAQAVLDGGPITRRFAEGTLHDRIRRLLERLGFHMTGPLPATDEVRYTLIL